ncbi:unnamed protein product, partial [Ectocarpus sp. 12 AP-2014]
EQPGERSKQCPSCPVPGDSQHLQALQYSLAHRVGGGLPSRYSHCRPAEVLHRDARTERPPPRGNLHQVFGPAVVPGLCALERGHTHWCRDRGGCEEHRRGTVPGNVRVHARKRGIGYERAAESVLRLVRVHLSARRWDGVSQRHRGRVHRLASVRRLEVRHGHNNNNNNVNNTINIRSSTTNNSSATNSSSHNNINSTSTSTRTSGSSNTNNETMSRPCYDDFVVALHHLTSFFLLWIEAKN